MQPLSQSQHRDLLTSPKHVSCAAATRTHLRRSSKCPTPANVVETGTPPLKSFTWCGRHLWHCAGSGCALASRCRHDRRGRLCGRRGTWRRPVSCGVAGVALGDIDLHFVWQAWHLVTSTFTLCGRRGTW